MVGVSEVLIFYEERKMTGAITQSDTKENFHHFLFKLMKASRLADIQCPELELTRICTRLITIEQLIYINIQLEKKN
jgi:hypothetical protein